ncbi:hypothetical protein BKH41_05800 [Helicobacter sp. 12S02232-10]|nr:hypothetical protein BKH41_05800 [Helicobacter sp. 12S02232-10]
MVCYQGLGIIFKEIRLVYKGVFESMKFVLLALGVIFLSGCSIWNILEGKISRTDWEIQKIVVDGKEYLSPQMLKAQAIQDLETKEEKVTEEDKDQSASNEDLSKDRISENTALPKSSEDPKKQTPDEEFLNIKEVATMVFDQSQHRIYGIAGCNNYFASYTWKDSQHLEIANSGMTRKLCHPDELMSFELRLMRNFNGLFNVKREKSSMVLDNGKMQIYLQ